ncbi:MAG: hypothetical protein JW973_03935 [Bacteroidales bacterium]|nr:hypothetical protein [Bacteroidales bacterium]
MNNQSPFHTRKSSRKLNPKKKRLQHAFPYSLTGCHSRMRSCQGFYFTLCIALVLIFLNACTDPVKVALETRDYREGKEAVRRITDQSDLAKVALEAADQDVRYFAVEKITDQSTLVKIAMEDKSSKPGEAAVKKVKDPSQIKKIALEAEGIYARTTAIEMLTDPALLAKLALESSNQQIRKAIVKKLIEPGMIDSLAHVEGDRNAQLFHQFILAFNRIPQEHRERLIQRMLPVIMVLNENEVMEIFGEIESISVGWYPESAFYRGDITGTMKGESFQCKIELKKRSTPLFHRWSTKFPNTTSTLHFRSAAINLEDILKPAFAQLPRPVLEKIIREDISVEVNKAARKSLEAVRKTVQ